MSAPSTRAASSALRGGNTKARPSCEARQVIASAPRTGRSSPVSESSPANSYLGRSCVSSWRDADAVAALFHLRVGKADDRERRQAVREVHLDRDLGRVEPGERTAVEHRE